MSAEYLTAQRTWRVILPSGTVYAVDGLGPRGHGSPRIISGGRRDAAGNIWMWRDRPIKTDGRTGQQVMREIASHVR